MLRDLLIAERGAVLEAWKQRIVDTYSVETAKFLKKEKDRFSNPVGFSISSGVEALFDMALAAELDEKALVTALDSVIRIRSVQEFTPSQAVGFILALKNVIRDHAVIRDHLAGEIEEKGLLDELFRLEDRIDEMALLAFEVYMKCREDLFRIKARTMKEGPFRLLERRKRILEEQEPPLDPEATCGLEECDKQGGCGK